MSEIYRDEMLRRLRHYVNLNFESQADFAKAMGVSPSFVSNVLLGNKLPPKSWLARIGVQLVRTVSFWEVTHV